MPQLTDKQAHDLRLSGVTGSVVCPACGGGSTNKKSMSVWENGFYKCWRASCGVGGKLDGWTPATTEARKPRASNTLALYPLLYSHKMHLLPLLGEGDWEVQRSANHIVYDIKGRWAEHIGHVMRAYPWYKEINGSKAVVRQYIPELPIIHFPPLTRENLTDTVVAVEDIPSSIKLSKWIPTISLCGVALGDEDMLYLHSIGVRNLIIALDADAIAKQFVIKKKYDFVFNNITCCNIDKDFKDMTDLEIDSWYSQYFKE
jgi:hypothetical protein